MVGTFTRVAVLSSIVATSACVGDDTVQSNDDAGLYPSDARSTVDATVPQDFGDDSGYVAPDDATVPATDASDAKGLGDAAPEGGDADAGDAGAGDASGGAGDAAATLTDASLDGSDAEG